MRENILIFHGGGPTAVINASLYGAIKQAKAMPNVGKLYAAVGGSGGILREKFIDLRTISEEALSGLLHSPASAIGTSRDRLREGEYERLAEVLKRHSFHCVLGNGGNGTMDVCGKLAARCGDDGIRVIGIPKTMDNDLAVTDHCPGYGSAARYVAGSVAELAMDLKSLPIHVVILEVMGRNAGWITAAAALAKEGACPGADLIYLPEVPFDETQFLAEVSQIYKKKNSALVVVSEGLRNAADVPVVPPVLTVGRDTYFGDVSAHLAKLVTQQLGVKTHSEKPGLLGRASIAWQSQTDRDEAELCGRAAVKAVLEGEQGKMVALRRKPGAAYEVETFLTPIESVMLGERTLPKAFLQVGKGDVTPAFVDWCRPLLGSPLPSLTSFR